MRDGSLTDVNMDPSKMIHSFYSCGWERIMEE